MDRARGLRLALTVTAVLALVGGCVASDEDPAPAPVPDPEAAAGAGQDPGFVAAHAVTTRKASKAVGASRSWDITQRRLRSRSHSTPGPWLPPRPELRCRRRTPA